MVSKANTYQNDLVLFLWRQAHDNGNMVTSNTIKHSLDQYRLNAIYYIFYRISPLLFWPAKRTHLVIINCTRLLSFGNLKKSRVVIISLKRLFPCKFLKLCFSVGQELAWCFLCHGISTLNALLAGAKKQINNNLTQEYIRQLNTWIIEHPNIKIPFIWRCTNKPSPTSKDEQIQKDILESAMSSLRTWQEGGILFQEFCLFIYGPFLNWHLSCSSTCFFLNPALF